MPVASRNEINGVARELCGYGVKASLYPETMRVLAILSQSQITRLKAALGSGAQIEKAQLDRPGLAEALIRADVVVVDPLAVCRASEGQPPWVDRWKDKIVVYSQASPAAMHASLALAQKGVAKVLLAGFDDTGPAIRQVLEATRGRSLAQRAIGVLAPQLALLPPTLDDVLRKALLHPVTHAGVEAVCRESGSALRSCNRWTRQAGIHSLRRFLRAARALNVVSYVRAESLTLAEIALRTGTGSAQQVTALTREVFRVSASKLGSLTDDLVLKRFAEYVRGEEQRASA